MTVREDAPAKINLFLDVCGRRHDGYHTLVTVMHSIDLCDRIHLSYDPAGETQISLCVCGGGKDIPSGPDNLVWKAAQTYLGQAGLSGWVSVFLEKRIPSAAGLGGGSSDAAAVLRALDRVAPEPLGREKLCSIAAQLGADVPFCVSGGTALCTGTGEVLTPWTGGPFAFVIAAGSEPVSTPQAYRVLDRRFDGFREETRHASAQGLQQAVAAGDAVLLAPHLFNLFEEAVFPLAPSALEKKRKLLEYGALGACMSGSGSAVFGLFRNFGDAVHAASKMGADAYPAVSF